MGGFFTRQAGPKQYLAPDEMSARSKISFLQGILFLLVFLFTFSSCREPRTATSCSGVNQSGSVNNSTQAGDAAKDPHFFKRRRKVKAQDGFKQKDKKAKRSAKKAEKGKKKQRKESKAERKWRIFKKHVAAENDKSSAQKGNSAKNERKQKRLQKKRKKHPQMDLFPKGGRPG